MTSDQTAVLVLEDGRVFTGTPFGAADSAACGAADGFVFVDAAAAQAAALVLGVRGARDGIFASQGQLWPDLFWPIANGVLELRLRAAALVPERIESAELQLAALLGDRAEGVLLGFEDNSFDLIANPSASLDASFVLVGNEEPLDEDAPLTVRTIDAEKGLFSVDVTRAMVIDMFCFCFCFVSIYLFMFTFF